MHGTGIIAGGGTGGHIYPAVAIARALEKTAPDLKIHFVGSPLGLESEIVPKEGFPLHLVKIGRLNSNVAKLERLKTLFFLPWAFFQSLWLLIKLKPRFVLGVGGYASAPILFVASLFRVKTFIWEPNAYPGLANRLLAKFVDESLVVFEEAKLLLPSKNHKNVGMPVREDIESAPARNQEDGFFHVLVFGGSQGAKAINEVVAKAAAQFGPWAEGVKIIHQSGRHSYQQMGAIYDELKKTEPHVDVELHEYLHDMSVRYDWAHLVVARSGASTLAELAACGKPAILVPYPQASDNHQVKNAEALVKEQAAIMIEQKDFTPEVLKAEISRLRGERQNLDGLAKNIKKFHIANATDLIARHILHGVDRSIISGLK